MKRSADLVVWAVVVLVLASSCGRGNGESAPNRVGPANDRARAVGTSPVLDARLYVGTDASDRLAVPQVELLRLEFHGRVMVASGGCNVASGQYRFERQQVSWLGTHESTTMGCRRPMERQDRWLDSLLGRPTRVELTDRGQTLRLSRGTTWATFALEPRRASRR